VSIKKQNSTGKHYGNGMTIHNKNGNYIMQYAAVQNECKRKEKIMLLPCQKSDLGVLGENPGTSILTTYTATDTL
jgi:hypothetical protein